MIVGTSIGALNAGALAQYPPEEQCTKARAGFGVLMASKNEGLRLKALGFESQYVDQIKLQA